MVRTGAFRRIACLVAFLTATANAQQRIEFNRDIRPILANHCVKCHGRNPGRRQAGLRLDARNTAEATLPSGKRAIVPAHPDRSELVRRITSSDPAVRMPPASFAAPLSQAQIQRLVTWVTAGAKWQTHWAYVAPRQPRLPQVKRPDWPLNPIDFFVLAKMEGNGFAPARPAKRLTLAKRAAFGVTGLPLPSSAMIRFAQDPSPHAYRRLLTRLLSSPDYGERMATHWLDLARYADTHGYHTDSHRDMWRWRDWVINAFNANMPFDQFTTWQIAGDLLPKTTMQMKLATGFHRNTMLNFENGAIAEEYLNEYIVDRVVTTGTVWLGQTLECSRCHDHKYDPFSQRDFYRLYAYFNSIDEQGLDGQAGNAAPLLPAPTRLQQLRLAKWRGRVAQLNQLLAKRQLRVKGDVSDWERQLNQGKAKLTGPPIDSAMHLPFDNDQGRQVKDVRRPKVQGAIRGQSLFLPGKFGNSLLFDGETDVIIDPPQTLPKQSQLSMGIWVYPTVDEQLTVLSIQSASGRNLQLSVKGKTVQLRVVPAKQKHAFEFIGDADIQTNVWQHLSFSLDDTRLPKSVQLYCNGRPLKRRVSKQPQPLPLKGKNQLVVGSGINGKSKFRGLLDDLQVFSRQLSPDEQSRLAGSDPIRIVLAIDRAKRSKSQQRKVVLHYLRHVDPIARKWYSEIDRIKNQQDELQRTLPTSMVMRQMKKPRATFVLARGDYRLRRERVFPRTPKTLPRLAGSPANRLGLARWLVSRSNPLTARVFVNRIWQMHFGIGLVRTPRDFGSRGEWPTHPQLLDWLAIEFMNSGWDVRHIHRLILESATYRQTSRVSRTKFNRDPDNRFFARGPRLRLTAEMIRDQALAVSGLLVRQLNGPSVYPYQPPGLWRAVSYNPRDYTAQIYVQSRGASLYRRSVYTFWKRSVPPPAMSILGAPNREICTVRRQQTNTPLQALLLMNDPTFVESARVLAQSELRNNPESRVEGRLRRLFQRIVGRPIRPAETSILRKIFRDIQAEYKKNPLEAKKLLKVGHTPAISHLTPINVATWTAMINLMMNLDETITRN